MKIKTITYKVKGKVRTIKNIVYDNRKEADYDRLRTLAQRSSNKVK